MNVTFVLPQMGTRHALMGFDGPGTLECNADGVTLRGQLRSKNVDSLFGFIGFLLGFPAAIGSLYLLRHWGFTKVPVATVAIPFFGILFLAIVVGRKLFPPRAREAKLPYMSIKNLGIDPHQQQASFVSKARPKGQVFFTSADGQSAETLLEYVRSHAKISGHTL